LPNDPDNSSARHSAEDNACGGGLIWRLTFAALIQV
jgi:hypothetical protein